MELGGSLGDIRNMFITKSFIVVLGLVFSEVLQLALCTP